MRLALMQSPSLSGDIDLACAQAEGALKAAATLGATVLVTPEVWLQGYNQPDLPARAITQDSLPMQRLSAAAKASRTHLVVGYAERDGDHLFNSAVCFGPDGGRLANHRKVQLYGQREHALYTQGNAFTTFPFGSEIAAILICYDVEFASHVKTLADRGVTVILVPPANMLPFDHVPRHTVPAMAAAHGVTIVYANYCGQEGDLAYVGGSVIAGPHGEVLAMAGETASFLIVEIPERDPARLSTQSADFRALK
jgi:predicted amidohydrolase